MCNKKSKENTYLESDCFSITKYSFVSNLRGIKDELSQKRKELENVIHE